MGEGTYTGKEVLLTIAKENESVAKLAEEERYYNASISRYYYSLYERVIFLTHKLNCQNECADIKDSHKRTIKQIQEYFKKNKSFKILGDIMYLESLKWFRTQADYGNKMFLEETI